MTTTAEQSEKDKAEAIKTRNAEMKAREETLNAGKSGKGLRTFLGMTRGRNPQEIQYENWDDSQTDTLPTTLSEFMDLRKSSPEAVDEKGIVRRLILGDNDVLYSEASDPVAEFQEASWSEELQKGFRTVVKNYAVNANVSIEDAVALIKPGFLAGASKK